MQRRYIIAILFAVVGLFVRGADPSDTRYTAADCQGTYMPYPAPEAGSALVPDSLEPIMVNHVGRHGARYLASDKNIRLLTDALAAAEHAGTITAKGRRLKALCERIVGLTAGRWGALDSLGMEEERGIASRMYASFPGLFKGGTVKAVSSYSPRCIMSMYVFVHQLSRLNNNIEVDTRSGRTAGELLRPFDTDADYREYRQSGAWQTPLNDLTRLKMTYAPLRRVLGEGYPLEEGETADKLAMAQFAVVASTGSLGIGCMLDDFFTAEEYNALWSIDNLRHYLQYSATTLSGATADMAAPLLLELIETTDAVAEGRSKTAVSLRFGHAETLMPLLALIHAPGCYYMTNYFDTVATHWRDFYVVPMAANVQFVLLRNKANGRLYLRLDLNEQPVPLIPGRAAIYTPWETAKAYLERCLPLILQP